jgi:sulfane dehydrogenase subunit SoxC
MKNKTNKMRNRRQFLTEAALLAGMSTGGIRGAVARAEEPDTNPAGTRDWSFYGKRSRFVKSVREVQEDAEISFFHRSLNMYTPLQDSVGIITPSSLHWVSEHGYDPPDIDPEKHRLMIHGMVDRPLIFTMEELKRFPFVSRVHYLECQANRPENKRETVQLSHGKTSCSEWTGVLLSVLLKETGVQDKALWIVAEGAEPGKMTKSTPLAKAMKDVLVAYGQNGEPVRPENGFPLRLVVPGFEGIHSMKWLRRIKVVDKPYVTFQEITRMTGLNAKNRQFYFEQGPKSVIVFPSGGQRLPNRGYYQITGLAWSGGGAVRRVEVSTDGGHTWKNANLQDPIHSIAHTRFSLGWDWNGEEAILMSRCTDELDQVQPTLAEFARFWGATPEQFLSGSAGESHGHSNSIQPWGVKSDGSVYNAIS